ncbi:MAG: Ni-sirohydrochlorin a,c-diamide reductive cyclase ATP-dependent reductase subunit [Methanobacteriaceae archaeon]
MKKIAIYGKGGIGKSTTVSNLATAYASQGKKVMVIGCDPKADTTRTICGKRLPTILDVLKENKAPNLDDIIFKGYNNVICCESGGPQPGVGCAGRGVIVAMNLLEKLHAFSNDLDVIIYDVLGDVVCGGFAVPLREDFADEVFIVSSGEYMSLYAANNISKGIKKLNSSLSGIICNCKGIENEVATVEAFAKEIGTSVVGVIPRSELVQKSEILAKTVIEEYFDSNQANIYKNLANTILDDDVVKGDNGYNSSIPEPMSNNDFEDFFKNL